MMQVGMRYEFNTFHVKLKRRIVYTFIHAVLVINLYSKALAMLV